MLDKAKLGMRFICFQCGTRFYDMNRPTPLCPECGADQSEAPVRDIRSLLTGRSGGSRAASDNGSIADIEAADIDDVDGEDDDLFDDVDADDDDDDDDDDDQD